MSAIKKICRLCLEKCENFEAIDENTKILLPKIDLTALQEPVMCKNCAERVIKCFDFKLKCLRTHNYIVPLINKDNIQLDLKDVYLSKNRTSTNIPDDEAVCGLCMDLVKNCAVVPLDVEVKEVMLWKMIEQYLPELDLSIVKKAVICPSCCGSLEECFRFVTNCLLVEQETKKYSGTLCSSSEDQNELNSLSQLVDGNSVDIIKVEKEFYEDGKGTNEDVQDKNESFVGFDDQKVKDEQQFTTNMYICEEENNKRDSIKMEEIFCEESEPRHGEENVAEIEDQKCLVAEEIEIKTDTYEFDSFRDASTSSQLITENINRYNPEDDKLTRCKSCSYVTKSKSNFKRHMLIHQELSKATTYGCTNCSFVTKHKRYLQTHILTHREPCEVKLHKCESCSYVTKQKGNLKIHMLTHQEHSEVKFHKCESCSYVTKLKRNLKPHMLTHQELTYICDSCSYVTKHEGNFKRHMMIHQDLSEGTTYRCANCSYVAKQKRYLQKHMLTHREPLKFHKCKICSYVTKRKWDLILHRLTHQELSGVTVYRCDNCSYGSCEKRYLELHMLKHRNPSEIKFHKCESCSYVTKRKRDFNSHMLTHQELPGVMVYRCNSCSYATIRKTNFKLHMLTHSGLSEVTVYTCERCAFVTKRVGSLKRHMLNIHK